MEKLFWNLTSTGMNIRGEGLNLDIVVEHGGRIAIGHDGNISCHGSFENTVVALLSSIGRTVPPSMRSAARTIDYIIRASRISN